MSRPIAANTRILHLPSASGYPWWFCPNCLAFYAPDPPPKYYTATRDQQHQALGCDRPLVYIPLSIVAMEIDADTPVSIYHDSP